MKRRDFLRYGAIGMVAAAAPALTRRMRAQSGEIVACAIHPAIGIARVGNSPDECFLGPETPGPHPCRRGASRTPRGGSSGRGALPPLRPRREGRPSPR